MENLILADYNVGENLLYAGTRRMWMNCRAQQDVFASKRARYNDTFIAARFAEILAAEQLPNDVQRTSAHETIRIDMVAQADVCCDEWQMLKLYTRHAFPKDQLETMYKEAGADLYSESSHLNWVSLKAMMLQGSEFIEKYKDLLLNDQNMPDTFQAQYQAEMETFIALYNDYNTARQDATTGAAAKVEANNTIYNACIAMALDGQQFFKNSPLKSQFSFDAVCSMISPAGASTAVITVIDSVTEKPIEAEVTDQNTERTVTTNKQTGRAEFGNLAGEENTSFVVQAPGYGTQIIPMTTKTSTTTRATVMLSKISTEATSERRMPVPENGMTEGNAELKMQNATTTADLKGEAAAFS